MLFKLKAFPWQEEGHLMQEENLCMCASSPGFFLQEDSPLLGKDDRSVQECRNETGKIKHLPAGYRFRVFSN